MTPLALNFSDFYKNLVPQDARMFINLLTYNGSSSSPIYPRVAGFGTIPLALAEAASYALYAPIEGCYKLFTGDINGAAETFRQNGLSALQCLALTVGSVAYACFGLFYGQEFYVLCLPQIGPTANEPGLASNPSTNVSANNPPLTMPTLIPQKILNNTPSSSGLVNAHPTCGPTGTPSQPRVTPSQPTVAPSQPIMAPSQPAVPLMPIEITKQVREYLKETKNSLASNEACNGDVRMRKFKINQDIRSALALMEPNSPKKTNAPHSPIEQPGLFQRGLGLGWQAVAGTAKIVKQIHKHYSDGQAGWKDARYMASFRWLQRAFFEAENVAPGKLLHEINAFCARWMTSLDMTRFHYEAAMEVASKVDPLIRELIADRSVKFSQKIDAVHTAIARANPKEKAPEVDLLGGKAYQLFYNFDHLSYSNMPSKIMTTTHKNAEGKVLETVHFRVGVPVHSTENREFSLVPEYKAFLNHLKTLHSQGKPQKLLAILHLNPELYTPEVEIQPSRIPHLPTMEAQWIKLMTDLAKTEYKDVLSVALIPMDGAWLHEIVKNTDKTIKEMEELLVKEITKENSFYILPKVEDKKKFVEDLVGYLRKAYFSDVDYSKQPLDETQKRGFIGLFNAVLSEALHTLNEANYVQHNCKDAADRTGAQTGIELCEKSFRLGCLNEPKVQAQIIGLTDGTCLGIMKRPILNHNRFDFFSAAAHRLDSVHTEPVQPDFGGYSLQHMGLGWEPDQCLNNNLSPAVDRPKYMPPAITPVSSYG
jgi:hypothetical protein